MTEPLIETRKSARAQLVQLAENNPQIFCIDSDVGGLEVDFASRFPQRYVDVGIAEANMMSVAAGIAHLGGMPFVNSLAAFALGRAFEQLRVDVCYPNLGVKILATHAGLSAEHLGPTHHAITDLSLARSLPNLTVLIPADSEDARNAVTAAAATPGPVFIRLGRKATAPIHGLDHGPELYRARVLRKGRDLTLVCAGPCPTQIALEAAESLKFTGIEARVLNLACLKPIDRLSLRMAASETGGIVTIEDHSIIGGLYSAVCEVVAQSASPCRVVPIGIRDCFVEQIGSERQLLSQCGVDCPRVVEAARQLCRIAPTTNDYDRLLVGVLNQ